MNIENMTEEQLAAIIEPIVEKKVAEFMTEALEVAKEIQKKKIAADPLYQIYEMLAGFGHQKEGK